METNLSNLIVNYLPQTMTDKELYSMFATIGPLQSCRVMKDYKTGYSYGFGFVNYTKPEDATRAVQQLNGREIFNKRIKVSYARPSGDNIKETNLFITNIPKNYTIDDLGNLFSSYGTIVQKHLLIDRVTKVSRGVAFIRFNLKEEAQEAIRNLNGVTLESGFSLSVRVAEEHGKQKAAYYAGWQAGMNQRQGKRFENKHGGRGTLRGATPFGHSSSMIRSHNNNNSLNEQLVSYPVLNRNNGGLRALRQERFQQRYNPLAFGFSNNGYPTR